MNYSQAIKESHEQVVAAMTRSYAPYSKLHVAAGLVLKSGEVVLGVNVENASYGATICAERSAICSARSQKGEFEIEAIIVISNFKGGPIPPCGICLQVLCEFASHSTPVYLGNEKMILSQNNLGEFLPKAFSKEMLPS